MIASLKPGGRIVMKVGAGFFGRNGAVRLFDDLTIERCEVARGVSDFYDRRETDVYRLIARK